jgi:hypothetical protein
VEALVGLIVPGATAPPPPPDTTAPAAPSGVITTAGNAQVILRWKRNGETDVAGYCAYRRNTDGTWPTAATATATSSATSWTDSGRTNGTAYAYAYRLTAYDT